MERVRRAGACDVASWTRAGARWLSLGAVLGVFSCSRPEPGEPRPHGTLEVQRAPSPKNESTAEPQPSAAHPSVEPSGAQPSVEPSAAHESRAAVRAALCASEKQVQILAEKEQEGKAPPQLRIEGARATEAWRGSLSREEDRADRIVRDKDDCGNWGECAYAVYMACTTDRFVRVYGPEYFVSLEPLDGPDDRGFSRLRGSVRSESPDHPRAQAVTLRFGGRSYDELPRSALGAPAP